MDRLSPEETVSVEQGIDDIGLLLKQAIPDLPVHSEGGLSRLVIMHWRLLIQDAL